MRAKFEQYVIHPGPGDPVPRIGSGQRLVTVKIGRKWVRIKAQGALNAQRIHISKWEKIPSVKYTGQCQATISKDLDDWVLSHNLKAFRK